MEALLGEATLAALAAITPDWRDEVWIEWQDTAWSLEDRGYDHARELLDVLLRGPAAATLRRLVIDREQAELLAGRTLPALEQLYVSTDPDEPFWYEDPTYTSWGRDVRVDAGALLEAAPALATLAIDADEIELGTVAHPVRELSLVAGAITWAGTRLGALERLRVGVGEAPPSGPEAAWLLEGHLAPALRQLDLGGPGMAELVLPLRTAPVLATVRYLRLSTRFSDQVSRELIDDPGQIGDLEQLSIDAPAGAPWLDALARTSPPAAGLAAARGLLRGRDLFFAAPHPAAMVWEWHQTSEGPGVAAIAQLPSGLEEGPRTLEEAVCALAGAWKRYAKQGWIDPRRAPGDLARLQPETWTAFVEMVRFTQLAPEAFTRELDWVLDLMRGAPNLSVTENRGRVVPEPRAFTPRIGPANRVLASKNEWNDKFLAAETDTSYVLLVWWTTA